MRSRTIPGRARAGFAIAIGTLLTAAGNLAAQGLGLPLADTANPMPKGLSAVGAGIVAGEDVNLFGARGTVAVSDDLRLFLDAGWADVRDGDAGLGIQLGGVYTLAGKGAADLASRSAVYRVFADDYDVTGWNAMLLGSVRTPWVGSFLYAGLGFDLAYAEEDEPEGGHDDEFEINAAAGLGGVVSVSQRVSFFAEVSYVGDLFVAGGVCCQL